MSEEISHLLNQIQHQEIVLPEFQREFTWDTDQSKLLIDSLLKEYPTGSLLLWATSDPPALKNMDDFDPEGRVQVLLDGQQRLTVLYLLVKDAIPPYYEEINNDPRNLYYHLGNRDLVYYKPNQMNEDPRWVAVTDCFAGEIDIREVVEELSVDPEERFEVSVKYRENLDDLTDLVDEDFPIMYVDDDSTLQEALTVFDRVNSQGTPLSDADIALAHMVSAWPDTRRRFKDKLRNLREAGFDLDLTFLVRAMNAVVNNSAEFEHLHELTGSELRNGWSDLSRMLDYLVNVLRDHAYIYSTSDLNTPYVLIPVLAYLSDTGGVFRSAQERNRMLYWVYSALLLRRHTRSLQSSLRQDLNVLEEDQPLVGLITTLREEEGDPHVTPEYLDMRGVRHPLYNMMHMVIRAKGGVDWRNGIDLSEPIGDDYEIQRHHIFPRAQLRDAGYDTNNNHHDKKRVNEIANRVPMTKAGNLDIFDAPPSEYLPVVQDKYPEALDKALVPTDPTLWEMDNYPEFLERRRQLIAEGINSYMRDFISEEIAIGQADPSAGTSEP